MPIILGQPFLTTESVLIDLRVNELLFKMNGKVVRFDMCQSMKQHKEIRVFSAVYVYYEDEQEVSREEQLIVERLAKVLKNFDRERIEEFEETVCSFLRMGSYPYAPKKLNLDLANRPTPPAKPSIEELPVLELKELPRHLSYVFLGNGNTLLIIIIDDLGKQQVEALVLVL